MATNANQPAEKEGQGKFDLIFPAHLNALIAQDVGHPHLIIRNNENNKQICLPVPEALSLDDGANYEGLDRSQFRTLEGFKEGGGASISEEDKLAFGLSKTNIVPGLDALAKETMFQRRIAKNPMTEMTFTGMNMRTLGLSFDLVPRNESEAKTIRDIEILLRSLNNKKLRRHELINLCSGKKILVNQAIQAIIKIKRLKKYKIIQSKDTPGDSFGYNGSNKKLFKRFKKFKFRSLEKGLIDFFRWIDLVPQKKDLKNYHPLRMKIINDKTP